MTGSEIRKLRKSRGVSQAFVARHLKIDPTAITNIEKGKRGISLEEYVGIMEALRLRPGDYLDHTGGVEARYADLLAALDQLDDDTYEIAEPALLASIAAAATLASPRDRGTLSETPRKPGIVVSPGARSRNAKPRDSGNPPENPKGRDQGSVHR